MRLIDANNFVNNLKLMLSKSRLGEISSQESISVGELATLIKDEPTAYDVDKVLERLREELSLVDKEKERCFGENKLQFDTAKGYAHGISASLEIIKSGGID